MTLTVGFAQQLNFRRRVERKAQQPPDEKVLGREGSQELPAQPWGSPTSECALVTREQVPQAGKQG